MPVFRYNAIDPAGQRLSGDLEAGSRGLAYDELTRQKLRPLALTEQSTPKPLSSMGKRRAAAPKKEVPDTSKAEAREKHAVTNQGEIKINRRQLLQFTEEISDLLESGVRLEAALGVLAGRREKTPLVALAAETQQSLREGLSFSVALRRASNSFDELYLNMIQAGEQSGALGQILKRQQEQLMMMEELKSRVRGALIYPAFMIFAAGALMLVFMTYLVPQMRSLFSMGEASMPLITQLMIQFSENVARYWWLGIILIVLIVVGVKAYLRTPGGRIFWDEKKMRMPKVGRVIASGFYAQIAQTLAVLLQNGIPLVGAIRLVCAATPNLYLKSALESAVDEVSDGASLSRALTRTGVFPDEFIDTIVLGEQTGDLTRSLEKTATRYDKELNKAIAALTAMIQPVIIIMMALMVGLIAFSMMSGIFQAVNALR